MKVLFLGLGSVGQRHMQNLKNLVPENLQLYACRSSNHNLVIHNGHAKECSSLAEYYSFKELASLEEAWEIGMDVVFVCTPTAFHLDSIISALHHGAHVFTEKPLGHSLENIGTFKELVRATDSLFMIGFQTRFSPLYAWCKQNIESEIYGQILSASLEWGTYLPGHHRYEDYRNSYAARSDLGGGVTLGLIHELDLAYSFLGLPTDISAVRPTKSVLDIDVEDTVSALLTCKSENGYYPVTIRLSYAQTKETRNTYIQFEKGLMQIDWAGNTGVLYDKNGTKVAKLDDSSRERNQLFIDELSYFLSCIKANIDPVPGVDAALNSLKLAMAIKSKIQ